MKQRMGTITTFVVHGTHISENLLHHKQSDVRRILESKGFCESDSPEPDRELHFAPEAGAANQDMCTEISFDDQGFVLDADGVRHR